MVHRQARAGQTEHHDREKSSLITTGDPDNRFAFGQGFRAAKEVRNIVDIGHVEPENAVQRVVQADRNQQAIKKAVDARTNRA